MRRRSVVTIGCDRVAGGVARAVRAGMGLRLVMHETQIAQTCMERPFSAVARVRLLVYDVRVYILMEQCAGVRWRLCRAACGVWHSHYGCRCRSASVRHGVGASASATPTLYSLT